MASAASVSRPAPPVTGRSAIWQARRTPRSAQARSTAIWAMVRPTVSLPPATVTTPSFTMTSCSRLSSAESPPPVSIRGRRPAQVPVMSSTAWPSGGRLLLNEGRRDMPSGRMPSQSQIRSQIRAAQHKAESQMKTEMRKAQRQAERELTSAVAKWERETNRKLQSARPKVAYTASEQRYLAPVQEQAERQARSHPERRDVFLCHAWGDRESAAKELHSLLESFGVDAWFSEKDISLGTPLTRAIDKGLLTPIDNPLHGMSLRTCTRGSARAAC